MNGTEGADVTGGASEEFEPRRSPLSDPRWRIACINWGLPNAPKAAAYYIDGDRLHDMYFDTWTEAVKWTDAITSRPK
jgi:hypothetical protein